jgi:hypothetical protein
LQPCRWISKPTSWQRQFSTSFYGSICSSPLPLLPLQHVGHNGFHLNILGTTITYASTRNVNRARHDRLRKTETVRLKVRHIWRGSRRICLYCGGYICGPVARHWLCFICGFSTLYKGFGLFLGLIQRFTKILTTHL